MISKSALAVVLAGVLSCLLRLTSAQQAVENSCSRLCDYEKLDMHLKRGAPILGQFPVTGFLSSASAVTDTL